MDGDRGYKTKVIERWIINFLEYKFALTGSVDRWDHNDVVRSVYYNSFKIDFIFLCDWTTTH